MPFASEQQRRYLYSQHPDIAARWSKEYPNQGKLPKYSRSHFAKLARQRRHRRAAVSG